MLKLPPNDAARLRAIFEDPVRTARSIFQNDPWSLQREIMRSVAINPLTAVKACHASGKTNCAAEIALWFLLRYMNASKVVTTAPTWRQVKLTWEEIGAAVKRSRLPLPEPSS